MDFQSQPLAVAQLSPENLMSPPVENGIGGLDFRQAKIHSPIRKRASIACRRCRRLRSKCVHEKAVPPCNACRDAGEDAKSCEFPVRGEFDKDRFYRHPRLPVLRKSRRTANKVARDPARVSSEPLGAPGEWDLLPPVSEVIDGIDVFTRHYFQLGFIWRDRLASRLQLDPRSVSPFLLLSILSISARLTPTLTRRFGSGARSSEIFMARATQLSERKVYGQPSLETCQAFFLLGVAQHRAGWKSLSYINTGISIRMAVLMGLHREETFALSHPTSDLVAEAESARRTLWMLYSQDHLLSSSTSAAALSSSDISTLLPCNEADFAAGRQPLSRAALEDTPRAHEASKFAIDSSQSIFASLIQVRHYWGTICRWTMNLESDPHPWDPQGRFTKMAAKLKWWEDGLPDAHVWNPSLLRWHRNAGQDMAYLEIVMVTRLCNIVLRRPYLQDILDLGSKGRSQQSYFSDVSDRLFSNVESLFEVVEVWFADSGPEGSMGAETGLFCAYVCGLLSAYLMRYPNVCSDVDLSGRGCGMLEQAKTILTEAEKAWPIALRWLGTLDNVHRRIEAERAEITVRDPTPLVLPGPTTLLAAHGLLSPTLPPLALPEASQYPYAGGNTPSTAAPVASSLVQTTALPPIYQSSAYPVSHPSPSSVGSISLSGSSAHPITPQSVHESVDGGYRPAPAALGPDNDGFEAELRFYLSGEESSGSKVFSFS